MSAYIAFHRPLSYAGNKAQQDLRLTLYDLTEHTQTGNSLPAKAIRSRL